MSATEATPDGPAEGQGPGVATDPGEEGGIAPAGNAPPFLPDTNESLVEEAEHGSAAEEELDAAADAVRASEAEERAAEGGR